MTTDDLLRRLDHPGRVDQIGHDMATLCADAAAEVRALTARLDATTKCLIDFATLIRTEADAIGEHGQLIYTGTDVAEILRTIVGTLDEEPADSTPQTKDRT